MKLKLDENLHFYQPGTHRGIVVLRPRRQSPPQIISLLERLLKEITPERLAGSVIIVHPHKLRVISSK